MDKKKLKEMKKQLIMERMDQGDEVKLIVDDLSVLKGAQGINTAKAEQTSL